MRRRTPSGSAGSRSASTTSTPPSPGCGPAARSSSARSCGTRTATGSATSAARRGSSSCWPSSSAEGSGRPPTDPAGDGRRHRSNSCPEPGAVAALSLPARTGLPPDRDDRLIALLLGRRTYDIFAAFWPHQEGSADDEIATLFNRVPKYVASRGRPDLSWSGSTQLGPDLAGAVREIRDRHEHVKVVGSLDLVQTLLREKLFDRLDLWLHPVVLGVGKKVFDGGAVPTNVTLLEPPVASPKGTVYLRYGLADGTPGTGDMGAPDRGLGRDD